jgi:hypothetical protein
LVEGHIGGHVNFPKLVKQVDKHANDIDSGRNLYHVEQLGTGHVNSPKLSSAAQGQRQHGKHSAYDQTGARASMRRDADKRQ